MREQKARSCDHLVLAASPPSRCTVFVGNFCDQNVVSCLWLPSFPLCLNNAAKVAFCSWVRVSGSEANADMAQIKKTFEILKLYGISAVVVEVKSH